MRRKGALWKLYPSYLVIILLSIVTVGIYVSTTLKNFYLRKTAEDLEVDARLIEREVSSTFRKESRKSLDALCKSLGKAAAARITLILPTGKVLGDSDEDPRTMENHAGRPEVKEALSGKKGISTRYSETLQKEMMYLAIPVEKEEGIVGVVRVSIPVIAIDTALGAIYGKIAFFGVVMIILTAAISLYIARRISQPIAELKRDAQRFAQGDLTHIFVPRSHELGDLAEALNKMAQQLGEKIRMITEQRNELETILSAMKEGVLACDSDERIITINKTAGSLLGIDLSTAKGYTVQEIVRNADLQRFIGGILSDQREAEAEIVLHGPEKRFLLLTGTVLRDSEGKNIGALVVLNDITRLRHLENIRREFVANVSHELKTPITSIKGYVETLREGAIDDRGNARKFLEVIFKQADLLHALVDDLLSLSKIEQGAERGEVQLAEKEVGRIIEAAIAAYEVKASERRIQVTLHCKEGIVVKANAQLLEQAIGNLLDNAIKYSEPGGIVEIDVAQSKSEVTIIVNDHGSGIAPEYLSRLFERFYRVDKGRSRELGGTGLGLAIVKHIIQAHGGDVTVESTPGMGSTFTIHLPRA
ncbi:MAG: cell wall metabolism sensor histidine kinase WalK [Deltaproteobacteria bacterium]|nr:cell wall metabolism sensor histidine kinase WalK [Deltaproteobacteria bacterium]